MHIPFDRIVLAKEIVNAAEAYNKEVVGKTLMYVFDNRYIEVIYRQRDFSHLTGVKTRLSALEFFKEARRGTLRHNQFSFNKDHDYKMCSQKVSHLKNIHLIKDSALFMYEDISTNTHFYKFGTSELNFCLCFGENRDKSGVLINECLIPMSLRIGDNFKKARDVMSVDYIFVKDNDKKKYDELSYFVKIISAENALMETIGGCGALRLLECIDCKVHRNYKYQSLRHSFEGFSQFSKSVISRDLAFC